jgi:hypothetical protein
MKCTPKECSLRIPDRDNNPYSCTLATDIIENCVEFNGSCCSECPVNFMNDGQTCIPLDCTDRVVDVDKKCYL